MMIAPVELRTLNIANSDRVTPPCPHFGPCGGCQLQHLTYAAQLHLKTTRLRALLDETGLSLPELQLHASPPFAYRNRIRLTLAEVAGKLRAGYLRSPTSDASEPMTIHCRSVVSTEATAFAAEVESLPHSARATERPTFLPITECPIAAPILWRSTETILALIDQNSTDWLRNPQFRLDQLELLTTGDESALQFSLYIRTAAKALPAKLTAAFITLCESLRASVPQFNGASIAILPLASINRSRRNDQPRPGPTWGAPGLTYSVASLDEFGIANAAQSDLVILSAAKNPRISPSPSPSPVPVPQTTTYWVPRGAFFQANRFLLPQLLTLATFDRTGQLVWDLYSGVGLFSRALARSFAQVIAVEIAEPAASALASHKLPNLRAVKATTLDFLRAAVVDRERPDLIVLDPPRTGAGPEICALLGRIAAPMLIHVSCSPETLPADLTRLVASGYRVTELHLIDLFPQTNHIETITVLTR